LDHASYSPNLALNDFHLFLHLKKHFAGKKFDDDDEVQEEFMTWFQGQAADFYESGIQKLVPRRNKCLDNAGEYVEKWSYVQAIHSQCRFCKLKMVYMFWTCVSLVSGHTSYRLYKVIVKWVHKFKLLYVLNWMPHSCSAFTNYNHIHYLLIYDMVYFVNCNWVDTQWQ